MAAKTTVAKHPLIGRGLHYWNKGALERQARIVDVVSAAADAKNLVLIEYFEWISGGPTYQTLVEIAALTAVDESGAPRWTLYDSVADMNEYYEAYGKYKRERADKG